MSSVSSTPVTSGDPVVSPSEYAELCLRVELGDSKETNKVGLDSIDSGNW